MKTIAIALLSIVLSVAAQFSLKAGMSSAAVRHVQRTDLVGTLAVALTEPRVLVGFILYGLGAVLWLAVLAEWEVSKAYPMVGLGFVLTLLVGYQLGEAVDAVRIVGVLLICGGVFLVGSR